MFKILATLFIVAVASASAVIFIPTNQGANYVSGGAHVIQADNQNLHHVPLYAGIPVIVAPANVGLNSYSPLATVHQVRNQNVLAF